MTIYRLCGAVTANFSTPSLLHLRDQPTQNSVKNVSLPPRLSGFSRNNPSRPTQQWRHDSTSLVILPRCTPMHTKHQVFLNDAHALLLSIDTFIYIKATEECYDEWLYIHRQAFIRWGFSQSYCMKKNSCRNRDRSNLSRLNFPGRIEIICHHEWFKVRYFTDMHPPPGLWSMKSSEPTLDWA